MRSDLRPKLLEDAPQIRERARTGPRRKYPTNMLNLGDSFEVCIETKKGNYNWPVHNRVRSAVYRYMNHGGRGRKFTVVQEVRLGKLMVVVTRTQ